MIIGTLIEEVNSKNKRITELEEGMVRIQQMVCSSHNNGAGGGGKIAKTNGNKGNTGVKVKQISKDEQ